VQKHYSWAMLERRRLLIAYISNISAKHCQNWFMCSKTK